MDGNLSAAACVFAADGAAGILAGTAVLSYFLGCFNGAVLISKYILHDDIRTHGSGNAGLTNFYRVFGGNLTLVVILTDFFKALIAIALSPQARSRASPQHPPETGRIKQAPEISSMCPLEDFWALLRKRQF